MITKLVLITRMAEDLPYQQQFKDNNRSVNNLISVNDIIVCRAEMSHDFVDIFIATKTYIIL